MPSELEVASIKSKTGTAAITIADGGAVTHSTAVTHNGAVTITAGTIGSSVTFPTDHIIQVVHGTGGDITYTHNGSTWANVETLSPTITVTKGNKVLIIANSVPFYTEGTDSHNGSVRIRLSDATNEGLSNVATLHTQNVSIETARMYGTSHSALLTTASGSGSVTVTAYVQASTESLGTVYYGDSNTNCQFGYTLFEIQS